MGPLVTDSKLYARWLSPHAKSLAQGPGDGFERMELLVSAHVDDLKGGAEEEVADKFMDALESSFGKLTRCKRKFEHTGVWHEQMPNGDIHTSQDHYVKQLRMISLDAAGPDEEACNDVNHVQAYWSLLGAVAWTLVVRADIAVFVGHLQRHAHAPRWVHLKQLNTLLRWLKRRGCVLVYKCVPRPWTVYAFPDSAFRAQDPDCLAVRALIVAVAGSGLLPGGGTLAVIDFYSRKQPRVCRSTFSAELAGVEDGISNAMLVRGLLSEVVAGGLSPSYLAEHQEDGSLPVGLEVATDNRGLLSALQATEIKKPAEPHLLYLLQALRSRLDTGSVRQLWWVDTRDMCSDAMTKGGLNREPLLRLWRTGEYVLVGDPPVPWNAARF